MKDKTRIERIKDGIILLKDGVDPFRHILSIGTTYEKYYGVSSIGAVLLCKNVVNDDGIKHGFVNGWHSDLAAMLHNWELFLKLIESHKS